MKLTSLIIGAILALVPLTSQAEELIYGNCKRIPDEHAEFYKCLSVDQQIVYTNILPSKEDQKKFVKEYNRRDRIRKMKQKMQENPVVHMPSIDEIPDEVQTPEETLKEIKDALKDIGEEPVAAPTEESKVIDPCHDAWVKARKDMQDWGDLVLKWKGVKGDEIDKELDRLTIEIGKYVGGSCSLY